MDVILDTLRAGLPVLLGQLAITLGLLGLGFAAYTAITPFHEVRLMRAGNTAAGIVLGGALVSLAIPLAATLATSRVSLDILIWGLVALVIQLLGFLLVSLLMRGLRGMIEAGNIAAAFVVVGFQLALALLNAGAMAG
jgi:putative membrane protein